MAEEKTNAWMAFCPFRWIPKKHKSDLPVEHVGLVSFLTYSWLDGFMWRAFRGGLNSKDSWRCPSVDEARLNAARLERMWQEEATTSGLSKSSSSRIFVRFVAGRFIVSTIALVISLGLRLFSVAYIMMSILRLTVHDEEPLWHGLILVAALITSNILSDLLFIGSITCSHIAGGRLRAGMLFLLYQKLMCATSLQEKTVGKIVNLYTSDSLRIFDGVAMAPMILAGPLMAISSTAYGIYLLGPWALIGFGILLLLLPAQMTAGKIFMTYRSRAVIITDRRVRLMTEYLANARFVKMYCWEGAVNKIISAIRTTERKVLEKANLSLSLAFLTSTILVSVATMSTLIAYTVSGNHLDSVQAFMYLLVYTCIQDKLEMCMLAVKLVSELFVAATRFQDVFLLDEVRFGDSITTDEYVNKDGDYAIETWALTFRWPTSNRCNTDESEENGNANDHPKKLAAKNEKIPLPTEQERQSLMSDGTEKNYHFGRFDLKISKSDVVGLAGPVSSGKTALLKAFLGQMRTVDGKVSVSGSLAYVPQQPWIFNASIRDNITFGKEFDENRYKSVLESCCLVDDISMIGGDLTEIGERGVTLSGGQKQRISLARALYSDRDIYLLDDPLASVDPDVAESLFNRVILNDLVGKTVILVTHQVKFLKYCDRIITISEGQVSEDGSHEQLVKTNGHYASSVRELDARQATKLFVEHTPVCKSNGAVERSEPVNGETRHSNIASDVSNISTAKIVPDEEVTLKNTSLMSEEEKLEGAVSFDTYSSYIKAGGGAPAFLIVVFVSILAELSRAFSYWWLAHWIEDGSGNTTILVGNEILLSDNITDNPNLWMYDLVYGMSLVAIIVFFALRSFVLIKALMRSSSGLHDQLFAKIVSTSILFFDTTPLGRIVNRFSRDMDELDSRLPMLIDNTLRSLLNILIYLALIAVIIPWFLIVIPVSAVVFIPLYYVFRAGARELQRLQLMSTSPLLSHVDASLRGVASIRAYDMIGDFETRFEDHLNRNTVTLLLSNFASRWVGVRLSFITNTLVAVATLVVLLLRSDIPTSYAGAAIIYSFQLLTLFQFFVRFAVDAGATFTSAERIRSYTKTLQMEDLLVKRTFALPSKWPEHGEISFKDFKLRYSEGLPLALDGVTFQVRSREKVGIVGRTGAGKSSLVAALFRLVEGAGGQIDVDGIDISLISLKDLRTNLSIIPQDPVLFSGTIRRNIDPFDQHIDLELWNALERCHLKDAVLRMNDQLLSQVSENGDNFSQGEKQLLCMARVLLRHTRIMILDEATASLDHETEDHIQKTLSETFADCTVLIIAHRLKTVLQCDRVLVMDEGKEGIQGTHLLYVDKVLEFDTPSNLMSNSGSRFNRMVAAASSSVIDDSSVVESQAWV